MNIFWHEIRALRKSTFYWTLALVLIVIVFLSIFPAFSTEVESIKKMLAAFPELVKAALGLTPDIFFSLLGFYSFLFGYILLCGSIQAMNLGVSILSKEVRDRTADFLLSKPITRLQIMSAKLAAVLVSLLITNVVYDILALGMLLYIKHEPFSIPAFCLVSLSLFWVQLIFFALGVLLSVLIPRIKSTISISMVIIFGFFIIDLFSTALNDKLLRFINPYKFFDPIYIIGHISYEVPYLLIGFIFVLFATSSSYFIYSRKDFLV